VEGRHYEINFNSAQLIYAPVPQVCATAVNVPFQHAYSAPSIPRFGIPNVPLGVLESSPIYCTALSTVVLLAAHLP
jgi:hypothetical protein